MQMEVKSEKNAARPGRLTGDSQGCQFAQSPDGNVTVGVVSVAEPSALALLAAGVAGMAARRILREQVNKEPAGVKNIRNS
jgi:hypothetical protein